MGLDVPDLLALAVTVLSWDETFVYQGSILLGCGMAVGCSLSRGALRL